MINNYTLTIQEHVIGCVVKIWKRLLLWIFFLILIKCLFYSFDVTTVFFQLHSPTPFLLSWRFVQTINAVVFLFLDELPSLDTPCMYHQRNQKWFLISQHISFNVWLFCEYVPFYCCLIFAILHRLLCFHSSTYGSFK